MYTVSKSFKDSVTCHGISMAASEIQVTGGFEHDDERRERPSIQYRYLQIYLYSDMNICIYLYPDIDIYIYPYPDMDIPKGYP